MKKFTFSLILLLSCFTLLAQDKIAAKNLVLSHAKELGLSANDQQNFFVSDAYSTEDGITLVYANQSYKQVPVMNQIYVLSFRGDKLLSQAGAFVQNMEGATKGASAAATVTASAAVKASMQQKGLPQIPVPTGVKTADNKFEFGVLPNTAEEVKATLLWVNVPLTTEFKLAWQVQLAPAGTSDLLLINIDAHTGAYINEINLTVYEKSHGNENLVPRLLREPVDNSLIKTNPTASTHVQPASPTIVNGANYTVIPYPVEAPSFGAAATRSNPWSNAPGNATTLNWHSDGTTDYNITRGNNVWATEDRAGTNGTTTITPTGTPATSTTSPDPLNFIFTPNYNVDPTTVDFQRYVTTNLFYWNNVIHDISYNYGFTETAGNFQSNNLSRGGAQNDYVIALAQSGVGTNNANFSTPADGGRGRMRMYLWDPSPTASLVVNTPATVAGSYFAIESGFSTANKICNVGPVSGQVVHFNDPGGPSHAACYGAPANSLTGKIALIKRGGCSFAIKVKEAQLAGAIAAIVYDSIPGATPIIMGGTDNTITIPAMMISLENGNTIIAQLANNVTVTMSGSNCFSIDGDLDAGIISHEYGHGISNRFTGGPAAAGCLGQQESGGEGWSDYIGLMLTTNWATATVNDGIIPRGIGTYVVGQPTTGGGIRNFRYSTDMSINPLTYASLGVAPINTQVHNVGEVWCTAIWEMTWGLIQANNNINPNLYNYTATGTGGNSIAMKLVYEGMRLQPCQPGFIDARNAIMAADRNLYNGANACTIWTAFAKRGMGFGALQGSSGSASDQTASTNMPPAPTITTQPADASANVGTNATFTASAGNDPNLIYQWQVSTDNGATWTDITGQITSTLTVSSVTAGMNGFRYRARVFYACATTNTNAAVLTVVGAPTPPVITTQPADVSVCSGQNATFTVVATGAPLTYQWQVSTDNGISYTNLAGATGATLTLTAVTVGMNNNKYRVIVTNSAGSVTSSVATLSVAPAATVSITAQPQNATACAGTNATFNVTASGNPSYQWQVSTDNGVTFTNVAGATTATLTLTAVTTAMNNNQYRVVLSGGCPVATVTSAAATLTVNASAISIGTQPSNVTVCAPAAATFTVSSAAGAVNYQWQVSTNGGTTYTNIAGATSATLTVNPTSIAMNGNLYRAILSSACNATGVTSNAATLTVGTAVSITTQPASTSACEGTNASFNVTATGAVSYQWQVSTDGGTTFTNISGATGATLTLTSVTTAMNNNQYRVVITGNCNTVTSNAATLTVNASTITIGTQPASVTVCAPAAATFTVAVSSAGNVNYQWQVSVNGGTSFTNIAGATAATLVINPTTVAMNANQYRVVITNACNLTGVTSNAATLTVGTAVTINTQPGSVAVCAGSNASFNVTAAGSGLTYQWQVSTNNGSTFSNVTGATASTLTLNAVTAGMSGNQYRVTVTSTCNSASSTGATLTVNTAAVITQQPVSATVCDSASVTFTATATGTTLTYQWQVSANGGAYVNISNAAPYAGATTSTLTVSPATVALNGNKYRVVISGSPCGGATSNEATLTVNAKPTVSLANATSGGVTGVEAMVNPSGTYTYQWYNNGTLVPALTTSFVPLTALSSGNYYVVVSTAQGCTAQSNNLAVTSTGTNLLVIYPSPNNGVFQVSYVSSNPLSSSIRGLVIYDNRGSRVYSKQYNLATPNAPMSVVMKNAASGIYRIDLITNNGERLATGSFVVGR